MYFMGKVVGKGAAADGIAFTELLNDCNGNPHDVLDRYMYFSNELRLALTKACEIFDKNNN